MATLKAKTCHYKKTENKLNQWLMRISVEPGCEVGEAALASRQPATGRWVNPQLDAYLTSNWTVLNAGQTGREHLDVATVDSPTPRAENVRLLRRTHAMGRKTRAGDLQRYHVADADWAGTVSSIAEDKGR